MKKTILYSSLVLLLLAGSSTIAGKPQDSNACGIESERLLNSSSSSGKLVNCDDIMSGFEEGAETVKVIVNLVEPPEKKTTDWKSDKSLKLLREKVAKSQATVLTSLSKSEFRLRHRLENQTSFSGEVTSKGLGKLKNHPDVVSIEPVRVLKPTLAQGIPLIHGGTYRFLYSGQGIAIAICDTGIDYNHPMLGNGGFPNSKVIGGYDFGDNDADPTPDSTQAHGTCCAGIAAGDFGNVGDYIGGVAYDARLYALKITNGSSNWAYDDDMISAWDWCITHQNDDPANPIMVISTSFSGERYYSACDSSKSAFATAANNAVAAGITVLVSSGNEGWCDSIGCPACVSNVISVGAVYDTAYGTYNMCVDAAFCGTKYPGGCASGYYTTVNTAADLVTFFSNSATFLTLLAPSFNCYTTDIAGSGGYVSGDYLADFGGTSAACPYAAGAVACLQSAAMAITGNYLTPAQVRDVLTRTGDIITDPKSNISTPRVNLASAIELAVDNIPPTFMGCTQSPSPNEYGWFNTDVVFTPEWIDPIPPDVNAASGICWSSPPITIHREGMNRDIIEFAVKDCAGNYSIYEEFVECNIDKTDPVLTVPTSPVAATATSSSGATVIYNVTATDALSEVMLPISCSRPSGTQFPLGKTTVSCNAIDYADNMARDFFDVVVTYSWSGLKLPGPFSSRPLPSTGVRTPTPAPPSIAVKFHLTGASAGITDAVAKLYYAKKPGDFKIPWFLPAVSNTPTTNNKFRCDPTGGNYVFNWSTRGLPPGAYLLKVDLGDGVERICDIIIIQVN